MVFSVLGQILGYLAMALGQDLAVGQGEVHVVATEQDMVANRKRGCVIFTPNPKP